MRSIVLASFVHGLLALAVSSAFADDAAEGEREEAMRRSDAQMEGVGDVEAKSHFRIARTLYDEGRFREAAQEFEAAYRLSGRSELLFNMYIAYRDAGLVDRAADALRKYIESQPPSEETSALAARLRAMEETLASRASEPAESSTVVTSEPEPAPAPEPAPIAESPRRSPTPFIVGGVGIAVLGVAAATGLVALKRTSQIDEACPGNVCPASFPLDERRRDARTMVLATDVLLATGAVLVTTGVILYLLGRKSDERSPTPTVGAACAPAGCAASMRLSF